MSHLKVDEFGAVVDWSYSPEQTTSAIAVEEVPKNERALTEAEKAAPEQFAALILGGFILMTVTAVLCLYATIFIYLGPVACILLYFIISNKRV